MYGRRFFKFPLGGKVAYYTHHIDPKPSEIDVKLKDLPIEQSLFLGNNKNNPKSAWEILFKRVESNTTYHRVFSEGATPSEAIAFALRHLGSSIVPYQVVRCVPFNFGLSLKEDSLSFSEYETFL